MLSAIDVPVFGGSLRVTLAHSSIDRAPDVTVQEVLEREAAAGLADAARLAGLQDSRAGSVSCAARLSRVAQGCRPGRARLRRAVEGRRCCSA